jgi:hypothetical protein
MLLRTPDGITARLSESKHRIKNTLATVQAIASQTLRHNQAGSLDTFLARLHALGEAHELLTTENWDRASLREVVERVIKPCGQQPGWDLRRVSCSPMSQVLSQRESFNTAAKRVKFCSPRTIKAGSGGPRPSTDFETFS